MTKTMIVRFRMDIEKIPSAALQVMALTRPSEFIAKMTYTKKVTKSVGWFGDCAVTRERDCAMMSIVPWTYAGVYTRDLPKSEIAYTFAVRGGVLGTAMEDLFSEEVAVGDMLVLFQDSTPNAKFGFVCCEGNKWERVCLMDDNAMLNDADTTPCIGASYWREADDAFRKVLGR